MNKFRVWDKEKKIMRDIASIWFNDDGKVDHVVYRENDTVETLFTNFILMQSTGLKDKNGVEIFEGGVLAEGYGLYVVSWLEEESRFGLMTIDGDFWLPMWCVRNMKLLGNIHANPELLKEVE